MTKMRSANTALRILTIMTNITMTKDAIITIIITMTKKVITTIMAKKAITIITTTMMEE